MIKSIFLLFLFLLPFSVFSDDIFETGAFYIYSGSGNVLVDIFDNDVVVGKTHIVDIPHTLKTKTNELILYFSDESIVKLYTNTTITVAVFDQEILQLNRLPSKLKTGKCLLNLSLSDGEVILSSTEHPSESSIIVSTPFGDVEITGPSTVLIKVDAESLLVFSYSGKVTVYSNRGSGNVVDKNNKLTVYPNRFPMRGDTRKYIVNKKQVDREELSLLQQKLPRQEIDVRGDVFFALINKKPVGINIH